MDDNIVEITEDISIDKDELKDVLMGDVVLAKKSSKYDWDSIINEAIRSGVNLDEQTITCQSKDWAFVYHIVTLDQITGVGI